MENTEMKSASVRLGENLVRLRAERGWRIKDLADATQRLGSDRSLSISTISRIETQTARVSKPRAVRVEELETFAEVFDVDIKDLLRDFSIADVKRFRELTELLFAHLQHSRIHRDKAANALSQMRNVMGSDTELFEQFFDMQMEVDGTLDRMRQQVEQFNQKGGK